jgi:hypothetical protein
VAHLGVRGTEFRAVAQGEASVLEVLEGSVVAGNAVGAQAVAAGFGTVVREHSLAPPSPLPAPPDLAAVPARVERLPIQLAWAAAPGVGTYRAQVFGSGTRLVLDGVFSEARARWSEDLPDGTYELRVRTADASGIEGRDARTPFTLKARPEPPLIALPRADARIAAEVIEFEWARNPAASKYRIQVADSADFASPRIDRADLTDTRLSLPLPVGTHHWRLASVRGADDLGPWGDAQTFTRLAVPPPAPTQQPPVATSDGLLVRWTAAPKPGTRFRIQIALDASFAAPLVDQETGDNGWLLAQPQAGVYHVRVRSIDADGFAGPFGQPQQIEVPKSGWEWWWLIVPALLLLL